MPVIIHQPPPAANLSIYHRGWGLRVNGKFWGPSRFWLREFLDTFVQWGASFLRRFVQEPFPGIFPL
jgi:hypothetical protein